MWIQSLQLGLFTQAASNWPPNSASGEWIHFLQNCPAPWRRGSAGHLVLWKIRNAFWYGFKEVNLRTTLSLLLLVKRFHLECWNFWPAETIQLERTNLLTNHKTPSSCHITFPKLSPACHSTLKQQLPMQSWAGSATHQLSFSGPCVDVAPPQKNRFTKKTPEAVSLCKCLCPWALLPSPCSAGLAIGTLPARGILTSQRPEPFHWGSCPLLPNLLTELNNSVIGAAMFATFAIS